MTTYEGGLRVPMMVMWKTYTGRENFKRDSGSHGYFTTLAAAAGVEDVAADMLKEKNNTSMA
jgi:arylsulfatase